MEWIRDGWVSEPVELIREVLKHTGGVRRYEPCRCAGLGYPHRPGCGGCLMDVEVARVLNRWRERERLRGDRPTCWCSAYHFPHRVSSGKCARSPLDPVTKDGRGGGG